MTRGLVDTSVFIARESRGLDADLLPGELAVSVVTHAELTAGVLAANELAVRARRVATLTMVAQMRPIPIDVAIAEAWAGLRVSLTERGRRANVNDMWIAATALAMGLTVYTQDSDFDVLADVSDLQVVRL